MPALAFIAPGKAHHRRGNEDAREHRRKSRAVHSQRRKAELAVDQHPVGKPVQQVARHNGDRHHPHLAYSLKVAARGPVEHQRQGSPGENTQVRSRRKSYLRRNAKGRKAITRPPEHQHQRNGHDARQIDALRQPAMAIVMILAPISLRDQRVQPQQQAEAEERRREVDGIAQSDGPDGRRPQLAHHDGVHNALGHPAQLAQHHRNRQRDHRGEFRSPLGLRLPHLFNLTGHGCMRPNLSSASRFLRNCPSFNRTRL